MNEREKILKFRTYLVNKIYTENEIEKATDKFIQREMKSWNRLVKIVGKEFNNIFK